MNTIDDSPPTSSLGVVQNDVDRVLRYDGDAPIPNDFLRDISLLGASTVERRPPKLRLFDEKQASLVESMPALHMKSDLGDTSQVSFQVAEFIVRRLNEVEQSDDLGAMRGFAAMDRIIRMYEHVFVARSPIALPGGTD